MPLPRPRRRLRLAGVLLAGTITVLVASPALAAAEGSIDHVQSKDGTAKVLYSVSGDGTESPDLQSLQVRLNGKPVDAKAVLASDATDGVRRTAVLAIDVSDSMKADGKFVEAKRAAQTFLATAPDDLYVGVVTFAGKVVVAQQPTLDRAASRTVVNGLAMSHGTLLYDGLKKAVATTGTEGQRSVIVLSDGRDTSATQRAGVTAAIKRAGVKVDVVALAQTKRETALLSPLSAAGGGAVISANDPKALGQVFATEARDLARQIQITTHTPAGASEGTLDVSVRVGDQSYADTAFVTLSPPKRTLPPAASAPTELPAAPQGLSVPPRLMLGGLVALGMGVLVVLVGMFGGFGKPKQTIESRIDAYTQHGSGQRSAALAAPAPQGVAAQAVGIAGKALQSNRGFEVKLVLRLEAAGVALKPAEWLLIHAGVAMGAAVLVFALTGGKILLGLGGLLAGLFLPWFWLGLKRSRRIKAFNGQLAGCLQLMAGSLKAGLSLAQALDTVVREGQEPLAGEFRRALVEARLGVQVEDALESISERMKSADFEWTVMAIRIQREVGGNLSELLLNVAATLRERDFLRRQVKALSAEGRFSAYILLALPPGVILYMAVSNPAYLSPLIHTPMGYLLLGAMVTLMVLGSVTMKKLIKVEV
jgi:tight adherence protein B